MTPAWIELPREMRERAQWCVVSLLETVNADGTRAKEKRPLRPRDRRPASVATPNDWGTFEEATQAAGKGGGVGFVLTESDPFFCVDLDVRAGISEQEQFAHEQILDRFHAAGAYIERSLNGHGWHVWGKRREPLRALKSRTVEVYDNARFIICTGAFAAQIESLPDCSEVVSELLAALRQWGGNEGEAAPTGEAAYDDEEVLARCERAANSAKFAALWSGDIGGYPSHSEADAALTEILCFAATGGSLLAPLDPEQVERLFLRSGLARPKSKRSIKGAIDRFAREQGARKEVAAAVDSWASREAARGVAEATQAAAKASPAVRESPLTLPPGLCGEIAAWYEESAFMPMREAGILAALSIVSGIGGRAYVTETNMGLALYLALVAPTGTGKEGIATAHGTLFGLLESACPGAKQFRGGKFASGQGFARVLSKSPVFVSMLDEFGEQMQRLNDPKANDALRAFKIELLEVFSKGGAGQTMQGVSFSDAKKDREEVASPNPTIVGMTTPETFFPRLAAAQIRDGLIPRFVVCEYRGTGAPKREGMPLPPPPAVVQTLAQIANVAIGALQDNRAATPIGMTAEARTLLKAFDNERKRFETDSLRWGLFTRTQANAMRVATVLAIGQNPTCNPQLPPPQVTALEARWAIDFVRRCADNVASHYEEGTAGTGDEAKLAAVETFLAKYANADYPCKEATPAQRAAGVVTERAIWRSVRKTFEAKERDFSATLEGLVRRGVLHPLEDPKEKFALGARGKAYRLI